MTQNSRDNTFQGIVVNTSNNQYVSERGEVERWKGGLDKEKVSEELKEFFNHHREDIKKYRNDKT